MAEVTLETKNLAGIFRMTGLSIPDYQRAYEWTSYHVKNLLRDTYEASKKGKPYLIGTIILHSDDGKRNIIDGQQRLITLSILLSVKTGEGVQSPLLNATFNNEKSFFYIKNTQREIQSFLADKSDAEKYKTYLLENLQFSVLTVSGENALDQAYTFFDSVNSKGKGLTDFDLLKAHHLMFIPVEQETLARKHNDYWQSKDKKHTAVFSNVLRRIRMWSRGQERDSKADRNDYYEFISAIEPNELEQNEHLFNRYMQPNVFRSWCRENDNVILNQKFPMTTIEELIPMEIPQTIEGGDSFFMYAKRYHSEYEELFDSGENGKSTALNYVSNLAKAINNDKLRMAFKSAVLLHYDKFGENRLIEAATCLELIISAKRFEWGKSRPSPIRIEGVLSDVKSKNIIPILLNSTVVSHIISQLIEILKTEQRATKKNYDSPTLNSYLTNIRNFYTENIQKIRNEKLIEKINTIYLKP